MKKGDMVWFDSFFHSPKGREWLSPKDYSLRGVILKDRQELQNKGFFVYEVLIEGSIVLAPQGMLVPMFRENEEI